ncbi:MAG: hypothetical protein HPZ91_12795 [Lentisphaeria bacterium]|nr:hypothetical protein [Lentisphaeria bacterium]
MKFCFGLPMPALLFICCGCCAISLKPYYTQENKVSVPMELRGLWRAEFPDERAEPQVLQLRITPDGKAQLDEFHSSKEEKETEFKTTFSVQFFRVNGLLYADCLIEDPGKPPRFGIPGRLTLIPGHMLLKVSVSGDRLLVCYPEKLPELAKAGKLPASLTWAELENKPGESVMPVFTAPGSAWEEALKTMSAQFFPSAPGDGIEFKRVLVQ